MSDFTNGAHECFCDRKYKDANKLASCGDCPRDYIAGAWDARRKYIEHLKKTDRYQVIREALPALIAEAQAKGGRNERAALIVELLEERDALRAEVERLSRYYKNGIDCFANPCSRHSGERTPPFAEFFEKYGGQCLICVVDNNKALQAENERLTEALLMMEERAQRDEALLRQALEGIELHLRHHERGCVFLDEIALALRERLGQEAAAALRAARKVVAWARLVYARPVNAPAPAEDWDELVDVEFHNRPEKPEGEGWRPLVLADIGDGAVPLPRINVKCETVDNGITGTAFLKVIRVEQEDDGSLTAVINAAMKGQP